MQGLQIRSEFEVFLGPGVALPPTAGAVAQFVVQELESLLGKFSEGRDGPFQVELGVGKSVDLVVVPAELSGGGPDAIVHAVAPFGVVGATEAGGLATEFLLEPLDRGFTLSNGQLSIGFNLEAVLQTLLPFGIRRLFAGQFLSLRQLANQLLDFVSGFFGDVAGFRVICGRTTFFWLM